MRIREILVVFSQIELKQLMGLAKWETNKCLSRTHLRNEQKDGNSAVNRNKKAWSPTNCPCPLGRKAQRQGFEGEEQVSWMDGGERWEAEESAGLSAPV